MRTLALPALSSTPSGSFSTCCTVPRCCQPSANAGAQVAATANRARVATRASMTFNVLPRCAILCLSFDYRNLQADDVLALRSQPLFKESGGFSSLDAAPHGVQHAASRSLVP